MAQLLPEPFDVATMRDAGERRVASRLKSDLAPGWLVFPNFRFRLEGRDFEIDFVLLHAEYGIGTLEVKTGRLGVKQGSWVRNQSDVDPDDQARTNAYHLRALLAQVVPTLPTAVHWGIALPDAHGFDGQLPVDVAAHQLLFAPQVEDCATAIDALFTRRSVLTAAQVTALVAAMCPTATFSYDPGLVDQLLQNQIDATCEAQVAAVKELDGNNRIYLEGRAGTGKTYVAIRWAQRALIDGQRVLLTCYNEPLGRQLQEIFASDDGEDDGEERPILVGPFLPLMVQLAGMPAPVTAGEDPNDFWTRTIPAHIAENWSLVTDRFDCIIVDEAQDFSPAWIGLLESLLDPEGANKFFLVGDSRQTLQDRGFAAPNRAAGWVQARLTANVRNPRDIATIARRHLDGASAPATMPPSNALHGVAITTDDEAVVAVRRVLATEQERGTAHRDVFVVAARADLRNRLRQELALGTAEERALDRIGCETAHRAKGLEYPVVIVVAGSQGFDENGLYVAITRASARLWVIGGALLLDEIGVAVDG